MVTRLNQLAQRMAEAEDLEQVQLIAANAEQVMREESNDWFGVLRFHDIELITWEIPFGLSRSGVRSI